jgi:hypothetical protein
MSWRIAQSLDVLLKQINELYPKRSKTSDGGIGDAAHASRSSDHNPWVRDGGAGIVTARDFTNDPVNGVASEVLAEALRASRDKRLKYVISNRRIFSGSGQKSPAWQWRPYRGSNPHIKHAHVSVKSSKAEYDSPALWDLSALAVVSGLTTYGPAVIKNVQKRLIGHGYVQTGGVDGLMGDNTRGAIRDFRANNALPEGSHIDADLIAALGRPEAVRPVIPPERANATVADLRDKGSKIVKAADAQKAGVATVATATAAKGAFDVFTDTGDQVNEITMSLSPFQSFLAFFSEGAWAQWIWVPILIIVLLIGWKAVAIARERVRDHRLNNTSIVNLPEQKEKAPQ